MCLKQLEDLQLAIAVARVYEGDNGPVLRRLLEEEVLSIAAQEGNRWLASWAFWMLHRRDMAVRALIVSHSICNSEKSKDGAGERVTRVSLSISSTLPSSPRSTVADYADKPNRRPYTHCSKRPDRRTSSRGCS